ncbi:MAG: chromosomal replication initiator protein DnaA [Bacteroidales bacterium]|nr:chromosomal replication initiator protein DnaA [Bacteroidales bacterium]
MNGTDRHIAVWNNCLQIIASNIDPQKFDTWFKPIRPVSLVDSTLTVEVPSDFFRDYIEGAYLDLLKLTLKRAIGAGAQLHYMVRPVQVEKPMVYPASHGLTPTNKTVPISTYQPSGSPSPFVFPGVQRVKIDPRLNPVYCFANLIEGECNRMGVTAGENISLSPGKTPFNPLFIFGGPGLGKTHLIQATGIAIKERYPDLVVLYVTGNEFKTQYMDAIKGNRLVDFMAFYMKIDVLLVDDIQDLQGIGSQNAFFNVFNHLHQSGKQLVFTSDRAPVDLQNFEERLLSRFKWGLSVELSRPEYETRLSMLRARAFREGVQVEDDVLSFLASRIKSNFRELEGSLISLIANATLCHKEITVSLAESITGKIVGEKQSDVTIDLIVDTVCEYFNITRDILLSKSRKRQIVQARQIAMYECRNLIPNCSLSTIGAELGGKDHATVLHACTTVQDLMATDKAFRQYVSDIEGMISVPVER